MSSSIFARKKEIRLLTDIYEAKEPSFLLVHGRRRIGKTYLVREFFKQTQALFFHLTGIQGGSIAEQLSAFYREFCDKFPNDAPKKVPKNWQDAFYELWLVVKKLSPKRKVVIFLDELPWLATPKSRCVQALDYFWNRYLSGQKNVILVVCGSAAAWMIDKILNDTGGLHGRVTHEIPLRPFTLGESLEFLTQKGVHFSVQNLADLYMVTGGVAKYLEWVQPGESISQAISRLCFSVRGPLTTEFDRLFRSLFKNYGAHTQIVRALAKKKSGLTHTELSKELKLGSGGTLSKSLKELELSGFIQKVAQFGKGKKKENTYILADEYSIFYLKWIAPITDIDLDTDEPTYWMKQQNTAAWKAWKGFAFERLCLKHIEKIKRALGILGVITRTSKWIHKTSNPREKGAEIDWVIDRDDNAINLFEAKYSTDSFNLTKEIAEELRHKKTCFVNETGTKKAVFTTLITPYGARKNGHYLSSVDQQLSLEDFI